MVAAIKSRPNNALTNPTKGVGGRPVSLLARPATGVDSFFGWLGTGASILNLPFTLMGMVAMPMNIVGMLSQSSNEKVATAFTKVNNVVAYPFQKLATPLDAILGTKNVDAIAKPITAIKTGINKITGRAERQANALGTANSHLEEVHERLVANNPAMTEALNTLHSAAGSLEANPDQAYGQINAIAGNYAGAHLEKTKGNFFGMAWANIKHGIIGGTREQKAVREYTDAIEKKEKAISAQRFSDDPLAETRKKLGQVTAQEVLFTGARVASMAVTTYHGFNQAYDGFSCLRHLMADVTGQDVKSISSWKLLTSSDLPSIVKEARKAYFRGVLPRVGLLFGGFFLQGEVMKQVNKRGGGPGLANMAAEMTFRGTQLANNFFAEKSSFLETYHSLHVAQHHGHTLHFMNDPDKPVLNYLDFVVMGSTVFQKKGGTYNLNARYVAMHYAHEQTPIAEVIKDLNAGPERLAELSLLGVERYGHLIEPHKYKAPEVPQEEVDPNKWSKQFGLQPMQGGKYGDSIKGQREAAELEASTADRRA